MPRIARRQFVSAAVIGTALGSTGLAARASGALPRYRIADLGDLGGNTIRVYGLNDEGLATGMATRHDGDNRGVAFLSFAGRMRGMTYKGNPTYGRAVNNHRVVAGHDGYMFMRHELQAWTWERGQRRKIVDADGSGLGVAYDINDAGQVAVDGAVFTDGTLTRIPTPTGYTATSARAINQRGDAVGLHHPDSLQREPCAFTWFDGVMTVLDIPGAWAHEARGVNGARQVCGTLRWTARTPGHAFIWHEGTLTELGNVPGGAGTRARAINDAGVVVGEATRPSASPCAFVWMDGVMHDMNDLLDAESSGWKLLGAADINNRGQIVGQGRYLGVDRAFIATPIDG